MGKLTPYIIGAAIGYFLLPMLISTVLGVLNRGE